MDAEQLGEFGVLAKNARAQLMAGEWRLRLGIQPSFDGNQVIGFISHGQSLRLEWRRWRREVDIEKLRTPVERLKHPRSLQPSMEAVSRDAERGLYESLLAAGRSFTIPAMPALDCIGADGVTYDVFADEFFIRSHFQWWQSGPAQWRPLVDWFAQAWTTLADSLKLADGHRPHAYLRTLRSSESVR